MRLALFDGDRLGLVANDEKVVDISDLVSAPAEAGPGAAMLMLLGKLDTLAEEIEQRAKSSESGLSLSEVKLSSPLPRPGKVLAAPMNYAAHRAEQKASGSVAELGVFLKANSSVIGPGESIQLPYTDRDVDQEGELGIVIGREAKRVTEEEAFDYVAGYTCVMDITLKGQELRSTRKSFDTFTPIGPWITTKDEVPDPDDLQLRTWVNGELKQDARTSEMIWGVAKIVAFASSVMTLYPGDVIATGTPAGTCTIKDGDTVTCEIEKLGRFEVGVTAKDAVPAPHYE